MAITILAVGCSPRSDVSRRNPDQREDEAFEPGPPPLVDIYGNELRPFDDDTAAAIVLVFTMQDCPIANSYIPTLNRLYGAYQSRGICMLLVHVDPQLTVEDARKHAKEFQVKCPIVIDRQHAWVTRASATRSPEVAVFSPAGEILYSGRIDDQYVALGKRRTHVTSNDLQDALEAILAGRSITQHKTAAIGCYIPPLPRGE